LAAKALSPECQVHGVEPEAGDDAKRSLETGKIVHIKPPMTIADGAQTPHLGPLTFAIMQRDVSNIFTVTDAQLIEGMKFFASTMKLVVEPTGCLGYAALKSCGLDLKGKRVGVIISGGNIDLERYAKLLITK